MIDSWLVLTPPIIVLLIAFITKKLNPSLITGIVCAALVASHFNPIGGTKLIWTHFKGQISFDSLFIYTFFILMGTIITLIMRTGGAAAFARAAAKKLKNTKMAETSSILLSLSLFIDDYLSNTTVGYVMRPLTDRFKVARAKLAFLVHSVATPLVVLAPISGWSAMITQRLGLAGTATQAMENHYVLGNPFFVYLKSIPFIFYSFLMLASVWLIVRRRISFGPMHRHEKIAEKTGNLFGGNKDTAEEIKPTERKDESLADLFVPLATIICAITLATQYTEKITKALNLDVDPAFLALFLAGSVTLLISFTFSFLRKKVTFNALPSMFKEGFILFYEAIIMLFLASILGEIIKNNLHTGEYLANLLVGNVSITLVPLMLFISSATIAVATGTSWGTMAIMIPITIPMIAKLTQVAIPIPLEQVAFLFPAIGAVLSGAVCGDHISPVSETTIMASNSAGSTPIDHATTQFFYALPALACTCIAFLISGLLIGYGAWISSIVSLSVSLAVCLTTLVLLNKNKTA